MKVVHTVTSLSPTKGGPSVSVPSLSQSCALHGVPTTLLSQSWREDDFAKVTVEGVFVEQINTQDNSGFGYSSRLGPRLKLAARENDLVHIHGLWMYLSHVAAKAARAQGKPYIITPRGMLEPYIMARSVRKKRLVQRLFQHGDIQKASCIHVLCASEEVSVRELGYGNPIAVIPNGIWPDKYRQLPQREVFSRLFPETAGKQLALSMSRIHPKKGLLNLAEAWGKLAKEFPSWHLVLAGPDELDHQAEVEAVLARYDVRGKVTFTGSLKGEEKYSALGAAEFFVLPSFSEGFSMAVLEAMICRLPVLLTPGCNFPEAAAAQAAIEVLPTAKDVEAGMRAFFEMSDSERRDVGDRGHSLVSTRYTWPKIAEEMIDVYRWCLDGGAPPESVKFV